MNEKEQWIKDTNEWALKVGDDIFNKEYYRQRQVLTDDTWKQIVSNLNITDPADKRFKMIPTKFQELAMQASVRKAINEDGVKIAGLAAAVPGAIIGGGALAKPVLSQMIYHPGTFLAETGGGTIGGLAGGAATDAITRGVSDYDSFANMIASNSTIPEQYAEMLNPGMLLGGLAGGVGGNVLYNNVVKPTAQRAALPYLMAMQLNKNIRNANFNQGKYFHGSPSKNIKKFNIGKDGGIFFTTDKSAAKQYTGTFGQGKVYNVDLDLGDNIITIDNNGMPWTKIDEDKVSTAFNIPKKQIHDIIGSYNLGAEPWYSGFLRPFGWRPEKNYYAIDQVVKLGKEKGIDSLIINNAIDNGKRLFSKNKIYDQTIIFNPDQIKTPKLTTNAFDDAVLQGKVGWSPKQNVVFKHGSENPNLQTFIPYETWDVEYRGASPYKYFVTEHGSPHNMMDERPFQYVGQFDLEKPIVQIGEFNVNGAKNTTRNQLVQEARNRGADSYYMKGIYDNKADDQNVIIKFIDSEGETPYMGLTSKSSTLTDAERLGIPKGERNLKTTNPNAFNFHLKNLENDLGYGEGFIRNPITWEQQINNLKSDKIGKFIGSGAESVVYEHPTNKKIVLKVLKSGVGENGISLNYLNNIINQRNQIPLQLPQYLYGRIKIGDYYYPVMQQKKIIPLETDLQTYIPTLQNLLKPHGFYLKDGKFTNGIYTIGDLSKGNIGVTPNGQLRFIDVQKWKQGGTINYLNLFK